MKVVAVLLLLSAFAFAKDTREIEVVATHVATRVDRGMRATYDSVMLGNHHPVKTVQAYDVDAIIDGEHVVLMCDDSHACEAPASGKCSAEIKSHDAVKLTFSLPVTHKEVSRMYKISGSW